MNFTDYFSLENFKTIYDFSNNRKKIDNEWRMQYQKITADNFSTPLMNFLTDYRDTKGLPKIENAEGHSTNFLSAWNHFINKEDMRHPRDIADNFYKIISYGTMADEKETVSEELYIKKYNDLSDKITKGNFRPYDMAEDSCQCFDCGQRFRLTMNSWEPSFGVFGKKADGNLDYRSIVKPEDCLPKEAIEVKVSFSTGELLVADWFRIPEFTKTVEYKEKDQYNDEKSINFSKGRIFITQYNATEFNFISVSVGNSSPNVYQNKNNLVIGNPDYDNEKSEYVTESGTFKDKGRVCTDLWAVTMIDKQQLIDIVAKMQPEKANAIVEDYIKENLIQILKIEPGEYNLKFHGDYYLFNDMMQDKTVPQEIDKFFTVTKSELNLENKKKPKI